MPDVDAARVCGDDVTFDGDVEAIHDWGSITKTMTARLVEELGIDLDAPITRWMRGPSSVTVGGLATHTSGLPRMPDDFDPADPADPWADYTTDLLLATIARVEPGEQGFEYSNLGYCLLGHIVSLVGDAPIDELVVERVLRPAGVGSSGYDVAPVPGHDVDGRPVPTWTIAPAARGIAGVHGPVTDLVRWLLVSRARDSRLGWIVQDEPPFTLHEGGTYGASAFVAWNREDGRGVAAAAGAAGQLAVHRGVEILRELEHA